MKKFIKLLLISYISLAISGCMPGGGGVDGASVVESMAAAEDPQKRVSDISFIDVNLSICLSDLELNTDTLVSSITSLDCSEMSIVDLSGIEELWALDTLWLHNNQISDITPLTNLTVLTKLWLNNNETGDISPLSNLTALTVLELQTNQISDISPILNWTNLPSDSLYLNENPVDCTQSESLDSRAISEVANYGSAATTCINP
ncbi:leucine-rich repeat domain-containing protein [Colwelliaceae bacterium BS250]